MKIVVTGATGNVGTSTLRALSGNALVEKIVGIARRRPDLDMPKTQFLAADIMKDELEPLFEGADAVIHLAWQLDTSRGAGELSRVNLGGSQRVFAAVAEAGVPALVHASSVGAYSEGPGAQKVRESWPTLGIPSSAYSIEKAALEAELDVFEEDHPGVRVARLRPALVFKRGAASEIRRLFVGPSMTRLLFRGGRVPVVPDVDTLRFQCIHSLDVGRAFALAAMTDARGAFNVAAEPVLDSEGLAEALDARRVHMSEKFLRRLAKAAWALRISPTHPSWIDLALHAPLMDTSRARRVLGWRPRYDSHTTLRELIAGIHEGSGMRTAPLHAE